MKFKKDIPATILYEKLLEEDSLEDCLAGVAILENDSDEVLKHKATAIIALENNWNSFVNEPHGYANICLILNGIDPVVNSIPAVHPKYQCYALWELQKSGKEIIFSPTVINYIYATLETLDFVLPPDKLQMIGYKFIEKYGHLAEQVNTLYDDYRKNNDVGVILKEKDDFVKFQMLKLLEVDEYVIKMIDIYNKYRGE